MKLSDILYYPSELYGANTAKKSIFPVVFEDIELEQSEKGLGVKYVIGGINWTYFRPGTDDYFASLLKLMQGLKEKGVCYIELVSMY